MGPQQQFRTKEGRSASVMHRRKKDLQASVRFSVDTEVPVGSVVASQDSGYHYGERCPERRAPSEHGTAIIDQQCMPDKHPADLAYWRESSNGPFEQTLGEECTRSQ